MRRISWFLSILGVTLGFIFGLYYAWEISPIDPKDAKPSDLEPHFQAEVQTLIALAYANTGNLPRAVRRLEAFPDSNSAEALRALAQRNLADGRSEEDVLAVAQLAAALTNPTRLTSTPQLTSKTAVSPSPPTQTPTREPPVPTQTSTPVPDYQLRSREKVCDPTLDSPLIQVLVYDAAGDPVPGVEVLILWEQGDDHFFTGLKPEVSPGYGDFTMSPGMTYTIQIAGSTQSIPGLEVEECIQDDEIYPGAWLLIFDET
jgi:hypothetical protein